MRIGLAILAVFLTVAQAPVPATGQTADNQSGSGQPVKHGTKHDKEPTAPQLSVKQVDPTPASQPSKGEADADTEHPVRVIELPSVSIARDRFDVWAAIISGALVLITALGVGAAYWTLKAINQQVGEMRRQVTASHDGLRAWVAGDVREIDPIR